MPGALLPEVVYPDSADHAAGTRLLAPSNGPPLRRHDESLRCADARVRCAALLTSTPGHAVGTALLIQLATTQPA
jgi:hypothetical protein